MTMLLERAKGLNFDRMLDMDEAIEASWLLRSHAEEYERHGVPIPEWLEKAVVAIQAEIERRIRALKLARLKTLEARLETYKTPSEKKTEDLGELAVLQKELGLAAAGRKK